jgi:abortive infection bacteriophage resistance protein
MARKFSKPQLSIKDQIKLLQSRGMIFDDMVHAEHCLQHISYYRLRAYAIYFESDPNPSVHGFVRGTTFDQIMALYNFDRHLRLTLLDAIERIEIAVRGSWAHHMAMKYGPHGYLRASIYKSRKLYAGNRGVLEGEIKRSHDDFIEHYRQKYDDPKLPPIWMISEVVSLGQLSKWQTSLKERSDVVAIAQPFLLHYDVYLAFVHHLATIRNVCAHHGRLWNKKFTVVPKIPRKPQGLGASVNAAMPR